jgi:formyl-CoA transferase
MTSADGAPTSDAGALAGVRVLELGHGVAGPFAARLLGDLGADVIKVEAPAGDRLRIAEPLLGESGRSAIFELLNWNKRSIALDLGDRDRALEVDALVASADIIVTSLRPARLRAWDLDGEALLRRNPRVVATAVTSFGCAGPDADLEASDLVLQALSGMMSISGAAEREPLKHGLFTSLWAAGLNAAYASLAALIAARRTGVGVALDVSIHEVLASELVMNHAYYVFSGAVQGRPPASGDPLDGNPLPTADGHVALQTSARQPVARLAELFDDPRLADKRFATPEGRIANAAELADALDEHLSAAPARDVFLRACGDGLLSGLVQGADELLECPQLAARDAFVELDELTPEGRPWRLPARLVHLSRTPTRVRARAPARGQHADAVLGELVARDAEPTSAPPPPAERMRPLAGVRVIDLSVIFAVPYMGALLADLGAEVIKVEAPARLDQTRTDWGGYLDNEPGDDPWNRSGTFHTVNRGKRSLTLDLGTEAGRDVLRRLIADSDVLLDNFTPRVLPKWGLTYDRLSTEHPALIMLSNTGYGSTGPWSSFKAQGTTLEATMGLMSVTGYADGPPARAGQSVPDFIACWTGLLALLAALIERDRSGLGQWIDLGMYQLGPIVVPEALLELQARGAQPSRSGARDWGAPLSGVFRDRGGGWLAVSVRERARLPVLAALVAAPLDAEPAAVEAELARWVAVRDAADAAAELQAAGIAAGPVRDAAERLADPHLRARGFHEPAPVDRLHDAVPLIGRPYRWTSSGSRVGIAAGGPRFGEANAYVLERLLSLPDDRIAALYAEGVVVDDPVDPPPARALDFAALAAKVGA